MRDCGEFLSAVSADIAENTDWHDDKISDEQVWFPFDMLNVGDIAENDDLRLAFRDGVQNGLETGTIYPVTARKYVKKDEFVCYNPKLASFLIENDFTDLFPKHLWRSFETSTRNFPVTTSSDLESDAEAIMKRLIDQAEENFAQSIECLEILLEIRKKVFFQISCLPDLQNRMISRKDTGYVNCGEMLEDAADCLGIHYVNPKFINCYNSTKLIPDWDNGRGLVTRLKTICNCSSSDINPMKELLVKRSKGGYQDARGDGYSPETCFGNVIRSLYKLYQKDPQSGPVSLDLHVLCEDNQPHPSCDACLWDEAGTVGIFSRFSRGKINGKWRMKGSLEYWQDELGASDQESKRKVVDFFHYFLNVSMGFPCEIKHCSEWENGNYLNDQCQTASAGFPIRPNYFTGYNLIPARKEANSLYGLDLNFIKSLQAQGISDSDIFTGILKDDDLYERITYKPIVYASHYGEKVCTFQQSYLAYSMRTMDWIRNLSKDSIEQNIKNWDNAAQQHAQEVMSILGVSQEIEELPVEEIYDRLAQRKDSTGIQRFYSRARMAIRKCIDQGNVREEQCEQLAKEKLKELWARVKNKDTNSSELKLFQREEILYWDNALVSRAVLDTLPKLEIGARVGASSVEKLFGVRQLKADDVVVLNTLSKGECQGLSEAVNKRLRDLRKYLLAVRLRDEWREDISAEAKKLQSFKVRIVRPVKEAFYLKNDNGGDNGIHYSLGDGDLLQDTQNKVYWICSSSPAFDELWAAYPFRSAVVEAICIHFRLTGTQIESAFREVLRNEKEVFEDLCKRMSNEQREALDRAVGISEDERSFWKALAEKAGKNLSEKDLDAISFESGNWQCVLAQWFDNKPLPEEFSGMSDFSNMKAGDIINIVQWAGIRLRDLPEYTAKRIKAEIRIKAESRLMCIKGEFAVKLHEKLKNASSDEQKKYVQTLQDFENFPFENAADEFMKLELADLSGDVNQCINNILLDIIAQKYSIQIDNLTGQEEPERCPEYQDLGENADFNSLTFEQQSLAYFAGNSEQIKAAFQKLDQRRRATEAVADPGPGNGTDIGNVEAHILDASELRDTSLMGNHGTTKRSVSGGPDYVTDAQKRARGEKAERVVERMLKQWRESGECLQYGRKSTISNTTGTANDRAHFDFWYETPSHEIRLLEVKSYSGSRVEMSSGEFDKANSKEWRKKYDLVLVQAGIPYILRGPLFGEDSPFKTSISREVASYHLRIELK